MKILVLDDDAEMVAAISMVLRDRHLNVDESTSASEAIELMRKNEYDMILLDYFMPKYDGIWFMMNAPLTRSTKVLLITGHLERKMINTMFDLGACGYLIKPFDAEDLIRNINFFLPGAITAE